jgi:hypothetical protein
MVPRRKSNYVRNIERAIFNETQPHDEHRLGLWNTVIYHNLVLKYMPTIKSRPKYDDYKKGWEAYLILIAKVKSKECLVYGLEAKKYKALKEVLENEKIKYTYKKLTTKVGRSYPRIIELTDKQHKILFIRHPSSHFSWRNWGKIINDNLCISIGK